MRKYLLILSICCVVEVSAQPYTSVGTEPVRNSIIPYATADSARDNSGNSPYIRTLVNAKTVEQSAVEGIYAAEFLKPTSWLNRQVLLRVDYTTAAYEVTVNGTLVGYEQNGALPAEFNITKFTVVGRNRIEIRRAQNDDIDRLDRRNNDFDVNAATIICQPTIRVRDVVCATQINAAGYGVAQIGVVVKCDALNSKKMRLHYELFANDTLVIERGMRDIELDMRREDTLRFVAKVTPEQLWSVQNPHRLRLALRTQIDGKYVEYLSVKLGVREIGINADGFFTVNGQPQTLRTTEYLGLQTIENLKEQGYTAIMLHNGRLSGSAIEACDSLGMIVISGSALATTALSRSMARNGGNPNNDPSLGATYIERCAANSRYTQRSPSVAILSVADGVTTGVNIYDSYLSLKKLEHERPVVYGGASGEWCTDEIKNMEK